MGFNKDYIICSAIWFDDGKEYPHQPKNINTGYVIAGRRHHNCFMTNSIINDSKNKIKSIQGFLTSNDLFLNRKDASDFAFKCGQIKSDSECLFSEDLY